MKPRNHIILAMLKSNKTVSIHEPSKKSKRRKEKIDIMKLKKEYESKTD